MDARATSAGYNAVNAYIKLNLNLRRNSRVRRARGRGAAVEGRTTRRYIVVVVEDDEDGGYVASVPAIPGVYGQWETEEDAYQDVVEALALALDDMAEHGEEIPPSDGVAREVELAV